MRYSYVLAFASVSLIVSPATIRSAHAASEAVVYVFKGGLQGNLPFAPLTKLGSKLYGHDKDDRFRRDTSGEGVGVARF